MGSVNNKPTANRHDDWEVHHAAGILTAQACTLSARHIRDGMLRIQFNREVAYYARGIVADVESGRKSAGEGLKALKEERNGLLSQITAYGKNVFGLLGGGLQVAGGLAMCGGSRGLWCVPGLLIAAQGANNIYENGNNIYEGRSDTEGPIRDGYQALSRHISGSDYGGNMAYGAADLIMSGWGLFRLIPKKDSWRLFRYIRTDKEIAIKQTAAEVIFVESGANTSTLHTMTEEWKKRNE
jgi:hypothetical protein